MGALQVFWAFLKLGLTSFGGPIAHLGYFRQEFVGRRKWLADAEFAQLLTICQFLPGPASSQLGFAIGLIRAGWGGAVAAFLAFTLPSAVLMFFLAAAAPYLGSTAGGAVVHGLKLVAVVVVAAGLVAMARQLAPDWPRAAIALASGLVILLARNAAVQLIIVAGGAVAGLWACSRVAPPSVGSLRVPYGPRTAGVAMAAFAIGLALSLLPTGALPTLQGIVSAFYRAGALVFGGGHVVLPLLEASLVREGWLTADTFMVGYGGAQAVPGPMFTLAAFYGGELDIGLPAVVAAGAAVLAIFLPGFLLLVAALPAWTNIAQRRGAAAAIAGTNAAVVGLLGAALVDPVLVEGIQGVNDFLIAAVGIMLLGVLRLPTLVAIGWCLAAAMMTAVL